MLDGLDANDAGGGNFEFDGTGFGDTGGNIGYGDSDWQLLHLLNLKLRLDVDGLVTDSR